MYSTSKNVENSLNLAWKYKILWVFALLAVIGSGLSSSGGGSGDFDSSQSPDGREEESTSIIRQVPRLYKNPLTKIINIPAFVRKPNVAQNVLGVSSTFPEQTPGFFDKNIFIFGLIAAPLYVLLFLYAILVQFVTRAWGVGSLTKQTILTIEEEKEPMLGEMAEYGIVNVKRLIVLDLIYLLISFVGMFLSFIVGILYFVFDSWVFIALAILCFLVFLIFMIYLGLAKEFAVREVISDNLPKDSIKKGLSLTKANIGNVIKLVVFNFVISSISVLASAVAVGISLITLILAPFVIIFLTQAVGGFIGTYKTFTWSHLYLDAKSK
jgi:hypothetical protein